MRYFFYICFLVLGIVSCRQKVQEHPEAAAGQVVIEWVDELNRDFSFRENWYYPEGVYRNMAAQLSCDGTCPPGTDNMKDSNGIIYPTAIEQFYKLVDTTHLFQTIESETNCDEWDGTNFIVAKRAGGDKVNCYSLTNAATHCSLQLTINGSICTPTVELRSILSTGSGTFPCNGGRLTIDKKQWDAGIMKAEFDLRFRDTSQTTKPITWKGKIYAPIETDKQVTP